MRHYLPLKNMRSLLNERHVINGIIITMVSSSAIINYYYTCRSYEYGPATAINWFFTQSKAFGDDIMWEIDRVHMKNRLPIFSSNRVGKDWDGEGEIGERIP